MIDFALGKGRGVKSKEVVYIQYDSEAKPLAEMVFKRVLEIGAYPIIKVNDESFEKIMFNFASDEQLKFFPKKYSKALIDTIDHRIYIIALTDPLLLKNIDPKKFFLAQSSKKMLRQWLFEKEDKGNLTWSLCLYGTYGMARESGLSIRDFWEQIAAACYLDLSDPIKAWKETFRKIESLKDKINAMAIDAFHIVSKDTDLYVKLGEKRIFQGGRGANIPSFEIFTSPDWRGVTGKIFFNFPLYRFGNIVKDIHLEFRNGKIISAKAEKNEKLLKEMINQKNADKIGEFSLTDRRFSKINKFMANTLYDENFGGDFGNSHLAVGSSYHDCYDGNISRMKKKDWDDLGFNESVEHTDIINTLPKTVTAIMKNKTKKLIYKDGIFLI